MKAWSVRCTDDWHMLLHAETREKARALFIKEYPEYYPPGYTELIAIRVPELDDKPFNLENSKKFFSGVEDQDFAMTHYNFCPCEICKRKEMICTCAGQSGLIEHEPYCPMSPEYMKGK